MLWNRRRDLYRNAQGRRRRVRGVWKPWKRNHYDKRPRWFWGRHRRIGRHLYRLRIYKKWDGRRWRKVRSYWHLCTFAATTTSDRAGPGAATAVLVFAAVSGC